MSKLTVVSTIDVYEVNGAEVVGDGPRLTVESHWNRNELVVLKVGKRRLTVAASALMAAISNAENSGR